MVGRGWYRVVEDVHTSTLRTFALTGLSTAELHPIIHVCIIVQLVPLLLNML